MADEQLAPLEFPANGLDLLHGFEAQRPGTTPVGINVRTFEPLSQRARGGARPGLVPYIPAQLPNGAHLIQHLNYIVDPAAEAILGSDDVPDPSVADPSTNPSGSNPLDPNDFRVRNRGRFFRSGGSGVQPNRNIKNKKKTKKTIKFVQSNSISPSIGPGDAVTPYALPVTSGNLLIAVGYYIRGDLITPTLSFTDSAGGTWIKAVTQVFVASPSSLVGIYYRIAGATGPLTVTLSNISGGFDFILPAIYEYSGTIASPLDGTNSNSEASGGTIVNFTTGTVGVSGSGELIFGAVALENAVGPLIGQGDFTLRDDWTSLLDTFDFIGANASEPVTAIAGPGGPTIQYGAVGASFIPAT